MALEDSSPTPRWLVPASRIEGENPRGRRGVQSGLERCDPQPQIMARPAGHTRYRKSRSESNLTPSRMTQKLARASLCARALRARMGLVFAAFLSNHRRATL